MLRGSDLGRDRLRHKSKVAAPHLAVLHQRGEHLVHESGRNREPNADRGARIGVRRKDRGIDADQLPRGVDECAA